MIKTAWYNAVLAWFGVACSPTTMTNGVPNLAAIDPAKNIWRSGQVTTSEGWKYLRSLGISRIVKLNFDEEGSDEGAKVVGMTVFYLPIEPKGDLESVVDMPDGNHIEAAVSQLQFPNTLVHCTHGQDRTGLVTGVLRMTAYGWKKSEAYKEMLAHHFHWELPALMLWWLDFVPPTQ
jgi:hypothetical protein